MSCQRNNPQKNVLPSLRSGGTVLTSLRSVKTTIPPSLRSGKTTFFFWFFSGCHKNSRWRELICSVSCQVYNVQFFYFLFFLQLSTTRTGHLSLCFSKCHQCLVRRSLDENGFFERSSNIYHRIYLQVGEWLFRECKPRENPASFLDLFKEVLLVIKVMHKY